MKFNSKKYIEKHREQNVMGIGLNFVAGVAVFFSLGYFVDDHFGYQYLFKILGMFVGLFGSTVKLIKDVKNLNVAKKNKQ